MSKYVKSKDLALIAFADMTLIGGAIETQEIGHRDNVLKLPKGE